MLITSSSNEKKMRTKSACYIDFQIQWNTKMIIRWTIYRNLNVLHEFITSGCKAFIHLGQRKKPSLSL